MKKGEKMSLEQRQKITKSKKKSYAEKKKTALLIEQRCAFCGNLHTRNSKFCSYYCWTQQPAPKNKKIISDGEYRNEHKNKIKEYKKIFYTNNKKEILKNNKEYRIHNAEIIQRRRKIRNIQKKLLLNEAKRKQYWNNIEYNRLRHKAYSYAQRHHQKKDKCEICGDTQRLEFHHTNYEKNEGFTLCKKCHVITTKGIYLDWRMNNETNRIERIRIYNDKSDKD